MFVLDIVVLLAVVVLLHNLYRYAPGNMWRAIRDDPLAAGTMGISVARWRMLAFVGSSAVTAVGSLPLFLPGGRGVLHDVYSRPGHQPHRDGLRRRCRRAAWHPSRRGGGHLPAESAHRPHRTSSPAGSSTNTFLQDNPGTLESLVYGLLLVIVLLFEPEGLAGIARRLFALARRLVRRARRAPATAPQPARRGLRRHRRDGTADVRTPTAEEHAPPLVQVTEPGPESPASADNARAADALLCVRGLSIRYANGGAGASDIDLDIPPSVTAIVGRNGAGKTSTLRGIAGFLPAERVRVSGSVIWRGAGDHRVRPRRTGRLGISLVPERFKVFPSLTVTEHFRAGGISGKREAECLEQFAGLRRFVNTKGGLLSGGERQLLAIALAVARRPRLLMVDELSLGLSPVATSSILDELVRAQSEERFAILLVDQAAGQISRFVDHYYLLEAGSIIGQGSAEEMSVSRCARP